MAEFSLPMMNTNSNRLNVQNGNHQDAYDYLIILGKSQGGMRFNYATIDPDSHSLAPKLNTIIWSRLIDLVDYATCVFRNCLYVIGGKEKLTGRLCREVNRYDPYLGRWKQCDDMRRARANHAAAAIWGKIYVFGGMTSSTDISDTCESYEPLMDEWHGEESLPEPRKNHACVATDNQVYVIGGTSPTEVANDNVWMLSRQIPDSRRQDVAHYEWRDLPDPKLSGLGYRLSRAMVAVCKEKMFVIGGVCHGQTSDGVTFIRRATTQKPSENGENDSTSFNNVVSSGSGSRDTREGSGQSETKWHIGTSPVIESYKLNADLPDFSLDPELEDIRQREKEEEDKKREKEQKLRMKQRMRNRRGRDLQQEKEEEIKRQQEEDEKRKEEEERIERMRNRTFWKSNLPDMPHARCSAGTFVTGNRIYVIGGHAVEDESRSSVSSVDYYHTRRKEWVHAFNFPAVDIGDIDCCVLTVPASNKDFKPMKYSGCKWVMW